MYDSNDSENGDSNLESSHLNTFGGLPKNSLCHILNTENETSEDPTFNHIKHSPYFDDNPYLISL